MLIPFVRRGGWFVGLSVATLLASVFVWAGPAQGASALEAGTAASVLRASRASEHLLTAARLSAYLRAAAFITNVPANLTPSLSDSQAWAPLIVTNGCQLFIGGVRSEPCIYGDTHAHTSVVLFGDSHAGAWFPALDQISIQRHWRLLIFTKAGCSPAEVTLYVLCDTWRRNSEAQIAALHPGVVFVAWAREDDERATAEAGVPIAYGSPWQDGVAAIFKFLRRSSGRVIFISDVPNHWFGAAQCISTHLNDVKPCNSDPRRQAVFLPKIRAEEFEVADRTGVASIDPTPWFCTPTVCPVLVRNIMVYYDTAHMTPAWSSFIEPLLATAVASIQAGITRTTKASALLAAQPHAAVTPCALPRRHCGTLRPSRFRLVWARCGFLVDGVAVPAAA